MIEYENIIFFHKFLIAKIGQDDIILEYPFFESSDPLIDWPMGHLIGEINLWTYKDWEDYPDKQKKTMAEGFLAKTTVAQQLTEKATD